MSDPNADFQPPPPPLEPVEITGARPIKLRLPAIILFVIGILLLVVAVAKILTISLGAGAAFCFFGLLLFALSFVPLPDVPETEPPMGVGQKLGSIFYEPTRVFSNLRVHPRWLAPFIIVSVLSAVYAAAFMQRLTPERIVNHRMDKLMEAGFASPELIERQRQEEIEKAKKPVNSVISGLQQFLVVFLLMTIVAALYLLGVTIFGGRMNFWQSLAIVSWASLPVVLINKVLSLILLFVKDPAEIHPMLGGETLVQDNLGVLFSPAQNPVLFVASNAIGALSLYGLWLAAKGLQNGGTKVSSTAAWSTAISVWLLGIILKIIFATLLPSFIS